MLLLLPAGMVAQKAASSSKYIATYESSTQTLTFEKYEGETLPENSAWVEDKQTVTDINNNLGNGTIVHIVFDKSFSTYTPTSLLEFFYGLKNLEKITGLEYLNTEKVTNMCNMFAGCSSLTSLDVTHFNTANVTNMSRMFSGCSSLTSLDVTHFNTAKVTNMIYMFYNCKALTSLDVTKFNTANVTDMSYMFKDCTNLAKLDVTHFNTAKVTDMSYMFYNCKALTSLDVAKFNTAKVTDMSYMFKDCTNLAKLDVTHFNTAKVTDMSNMFSGCSKLTSLDVTKFNTEKVTNMSYMFYNCKALTSLNVTNFNTAKVTDMRNMFWGCSSLTSLDVAKFNTEKVTNMSYMFSNCKALTSLDVTNFNSENVTNMSYMFYYCSKLTSLDVSNFNTKKVTNMGSMFSYCSTLTTIYVNDKFVIDKVTNGSYMFDNCTNLKDYAPSKKNHNYANYKTGYFTKLVGKNGDEKIGATGETLATDNLVLDDDKDFVAYEPFAAKAASYSRTIKTGTTWATLCLPFEVSLDDQNFRAFKLLSADDVTETVELEEIKTSIEAGTPVIIKMKDGANSLSISEADKAIAKDVQTSKADNGNYQLQGLYTQKLFSKDADNNCYIVKGDKLMNPAKLLEATSTKFVGSKPFRAYMVDNSSSSAPAAGARMFSISVGGSTTAIEQLESTADSKAEYYDLQGRRLQDLQKGVNIVKRGGKTMKVIIK